MVGEKIQLESIPFFKIYLILANNHRIWTIQIFTSYILEYFLTGSIRPSNSEESFLNQLKD